MIHIFWFQHRYLPVGVDPRFLSYSIVLYKCKCGHVIAKEIRGKWTLDQIQERLLSKIKL